jgi:hypothetical protein
MMNAHPAHKTATTSRQIPSNIGGFYYTRAGRRVVDQRAKLWGWSTSAGQAIFLLRQDLGSYIAIWKTKTSSRLFTNSELGMAESHLRALRSMEAEEVASNIES